MIETQASKQGVIQRVQELQTFVRQVLESAPLKSHDAEARYGWTLHRLSMCIYIVKILVGGISKE